MRMPVTPSLESVTSWQDLLRAFPAEVGGPVLHQDPPALEQVRAGVGRLDFVPDHVRQGRLDDLSWMIRLFGLPPILPYLKS